jgi:chromosome segregation ATPase
MSFRSQLSQMRREYRKDAQKMDQKIDHLAIKMDQGLGAVQERLGRAETSIAGLDATVGQMQTTMSHMHIQLQATRDELSATNEAVGGLRGDLRETARTMQGRARLMEERFGTMLDLVESSLEESPTMEHIHRLDERLRALEAKAEPAA